MLYLLPNLLADLKEHKPYLPSSVDAVVARLTHLIAESEKGGRRFLRRFTFIPPKTFRDIPIYLLNEHSSDRDKNALLEEIKQGGMWGIVSDCGMPCLADPGADLVLMARDKGIPIEAFVGPSSILLALILSGLGGQHFTFHGYLPKDEKQLISELKQIEQRSFQEKSTHLFIEAPYRNRKLLEILLTKLEERIWLSIACDLTLPTQFVHTQKIRDWKKNRLLDLDKRPAVFVLRG